MGNGTNTGNIKIQSSIKSHVMFCRAYFVHVLTSCVCFQAAAHQRGSYPGWEGRLAPRPPTQTWRGVCTGQTAPAPPPTSTRSTPTQSLKQNTLTCSLTVIIWIHFPASDRHFLPLQPMMLRDLRFGVEPDDGENLRRIGRSLSGTVVTSRRSRLTATRSFVSVTS